MYLQPILASGQALVNQVHQHFMVMQIFVSRQEFEDPKVDDFAAACALGDKVGLQRKIYELVESIKNLQGMVGDSLELSFFFSCPEEKLNERNSSRDIHPIVSNMYYKTFPEVNPRSHIAIEPIEDSFRVAYYVVGKTCSLTRTDMNKKKSLK